MFIDIQLGNLFLFKFLIVMKHGALMSLNKLKYSWQTSNLETCFCLSSLL